MGAFAVPLSTTLTWLHVTYTLYSAPNPQALAPQQGTISGNRADVELYSDLERQI